MFHVSPDHKPRTCYAQQGNCPYGGADAGNHFESLTDALHEATRRILSSAPQGEVSETEKNPVYAPYPTEDEVAAYKHLEDEAEAAIENFLHTKNSYHPDEKDRLLMHDERALNAVRDSPNRELVLKCISHMSGIQGGKRGPRKFTTAGSEAVLTSKALTFEDIVEHADEITTTPERTAALLEARGDVPQKVIDSLRSPEIVWGRPLDSLEAQAVVDSYYKFGSKLPEDEYYVASPEPLLSNAYTIANPRDAYTPSADDPTFPHSLAHMRGRVHADPKRYKKLLKGLKKQRFRNKFRNVDGKVWAEEHNLSILLKATNTFLNYNKVNSALKGSS